jgi:hypothetical protein
MESVERTVEFCAREDMLGELLAQSRLGITAWTIEEYWFPQFYVTTG